jgi:hypothetical protein
MLLNLLALAHLLKLVDLRSVKFDLLPKVLFLPPLLHFSLFSNLLYFFSQHTLVCMFAEYVRHKKEVALVIIDPN